MNALFSAAGGRKMFLGLVALIGVVAIALVREVDPQIIIPAVVALAGLGQFSVAWEDRSKSNAAKPREENQ